MKSAGPEKRPMHLKIISRDGDIVRVEASGQIVQGALADRPDPLADLLGAGAYTQRVLLSLAEATFIDSTGLGWLLRCNKDFREASGRLVIHSVPPIILDVIKVMRLEEVLTLAEDEASARAKL